MFIPLNELAPSLLPSTNSPLMIDMYMKYIYMTAEYIIVSKCKQANVIGMIFRT
jgi:hypothetical protein